MQSRYIKTKITVICLRKERRRRTLRQGGSLSIAKMGRLFLFPLSTPLPLNYRLLTEKEKYIDKGGRINEYTNYYRNWTYRIYHSSRYFSSSKRKEEIKAVLKLQRRCFR